MLTDIDEASAPEPTPDHQSGVSPESNGHADARGAEQTDGNADPTGDVQPAGHAMSPGDAEPAGQTDPAIERRLRLERLLRRGVRRFVADLPKVLASQDKRAVHDLRVWSRRIQQVLVALYGDKPSSRVRSISTALKRTRRALGPWRNHDVVLEALGRLEGRARSAERRRAWTLVSDAAQTSRKREVRRARKRLMKLEIFSLVEAADGLTRIPADHAGATPDASFWTALMAAFEQWREALTVALKSNAQDDIHALRICTKRMRYRIELARELGIEETAPLLGWCRRLQDELGRWRDRLELERMISRTLADAELLIAQPRVGIILLAELDRVQRMSARAMRRELVAIGHSAELTRCEQWLRAHAGGKDPASAEAAAESDS